MCSDVVWYVLGVAFSAASTLYFRMGSRKTNWDTMSKFRPKTVFWVDQVPSPCPSFLKDMGPFLSVSVASFGGNISSIFMEQVPDHLVPLLGASLDD